MDRSLLLASLGKDLARVIETVEYRSEVLGVAGNAVRFAQLRCLFHYGREFTQRTDEISLAFVCKQGKVRTFGIDTQLGCLAADRAQAGVAVLHVIDRVIGGLGFPQAEIDIDALVHRGSH